MQLAATFSMEGSMANCNSTASTVSAVRQLKMACLTVMSLRSVRDSMPRKGPGNDRAHGIFIVMPVGNAPRPAGRRDAPAPLVIAQHVEADLRALLRGFPEQRLLALAIHRQVLVRALCTQK